MTFVRRLDLHVHSVSSPDGHSTLDQYVQHLAGTGLDGFALTDHNSVAGHERLAELARLRPELRLLAGVEVSALEGHLLVYGVAEAPPIGEPVMATLDWVQRHGGVGVIAHPFRRIHGVGEAVVRATAPSAIETMNGHNGRRANAHAAAIARGRTLGLTGGSDAHTVGELGRAWTVFPDGVETTEELLEALRAGRTTAGGASASWLGRTATSLRSGLLRLGRGLRPI